jgi:VWFA-related protein
MTRPTLVLIILILHQLAVCAQEPEIIKVQVDLVSVNVAVTDGGKQPVRDLRAQDFQVSEEGQPVSLQFFDSQGPASIVFIIDTSTSMAGQKWKKLQDGMERFLATAREGNDYSLVAFSDRPRLVVSSVNAADFQRNFNALKIAGNTALYDAVLLGLEVLAQSRHRHKALVLLSDGQDNCSQAQFTEVQEEGLSRRATMYTIGIRLRRSDDYLLDFELAGKELLNRLATMTGGSFYFPDPDKIPKVLEEINNDLMGQYTLSYYTTEKSPGWRNVQVSVLPPARRLHLRYQRRYLKK